MTSGQGDLRIILLGKTGAGKSATGNTILGRNAFKENSEICEKQKGYLDGKNIVVFDTPGLFSASISKEQVRAEIERCVEMSAPGPHVFLLVIKLGVRFTEEERNSVQWIQENFGEEALHRTIILFTHTDLLRGKSLEQYIRESCYLPNIVDSCGGRYHSFNNKDRINQHQITELLQKINALRRANGMRHYTPEMFRTIQTEITEKDGMNLLSITHILSIIIVIGVIFLGTQQYNNNWLQKEEVKLKNDIEQIKKDMQQLLLDIQETEKKKNLLNKDLQEKKNEEQTLKEKVQKKEQEKNQLRIEFLQKAEDEKDLKNKIQEKEQEENQLRNELPQKEEDEKDLKNKIQEKEHEENRVRNELQQKEQEEVLMKNEQTEEKLQLQVNYKLQQKVQEKHQLKHKLLQKKQEKRQIKQDLVQKEKENDQLREELLQKEQEKWRLTNELLENKLNQYQIKKELEQKEQEKQELKNYLQQNEKDNQKLNKTLQQKENERKELEKKLLQYKQKVQ